VERNLEECEACGVWKIESVGWYSSCGEGKGYSNREEGSNGVPRIADGECNLIPVNGKVMPLEPSGMVLTNSVMMIKTGVQVPWRFFSAVRSFRGGFKSSEAAAASSRQRIGGG